MDWKLFRFDCDFSRMGALSGVFISTQEAVDAAIGKRAYFGEVLGKHSEVWCDLDASMITACPASMVNIDTVGVEKKLNGSPHHWITLGGYNPLEWLEDV